MIMLKKIHDRFHRLNFEKKTKIFISCVIVGSAFLILLMSTLSSMFSISKRSKNLINSYLDKVSQSYSTTIEQYYNLANSLIPNNYIQDYLNNKNDDNAEIIGAVLGQLLLQQPNINFLVITRPDRNYIYRGKMSLFTSDYLDNAYKVNSKSVSTGYGESEISITDDFFLDETYSVTFYSPIYDMRRIGKIIGNICINLSKETISFLFNKSGLNMTFDTYLVDKNCKIVFGENSAQINNSVLDSYVLGIDSGEIRKDGKVFLYKKIEKSDYYVLGEIENSELRRDTVVTFIVLCGAILVMVIFCLSISNRLIKVYYTPFNSLIRNMQKVANGNLDTRIDIVNATEDLLIIESAFNTMMNRINDLIIQKEIEQKRVEQLRINALHSQIKPHFLYNTLDCIHWQAAVEGKTEVSTMVKALASYYRICLSKGKDIIPLSKEIEHVENYLVIQKMRYGDIIENEITIPEELKKTVIPKLTLQPLVENSIYHGLRVKEGNHGKIVICAEKKKSCVIITVSDSGNGMEKAQIEKINNSLDKLDESFGYGVYNVNQRIRLQFGDDYGLFFFDNEFGGVSVNIKIPDTQMEEEY